MGQICSMHLRTCTDRAGGVRNDTCDEDPRDRVRGGTYDELERYNIVLNVAHAFLANG
jgi:hypothetical protein